MRKQIETYNYHSAHNKGILRPTLSHEELVLLHQSLAGVECNTSHHLNVDKNECRMLTRSMATCTVEWPQSAKILKSSLHPCHTGARELPSTSKAWGFLKEFNLKGIVVVLHGHSEFSAIATRGTSGAVRFICAANFQFKLILKLLYLKLFKWKIIKILCKKLLL